MKNLKVSSKLLISFTVVVVLAIAVGVIGLFGMSSINGADSALYEENVIALSAMGNIREILQDQLVQIRNIALSDGDIGKMEQHHDTLTLLEQEMTKYLAEYESTMTDAEAEYEYFEAKNTYLADFADAKNRVLEASYESAAAAHEAIFDPKISEIRNSMVSSFDNAMQYNEHWAKEKVDSKSKLYNTMLIAEIAILAFAVIVALFFAVYISGIISKPLRLLSAFMSKAGSAGDIELTPKDAENIKYLSQLKDEIGQSIAGSASFVNHVSNIAKELETIAAGDLTSEVAVLSEKDTMGLSLKKMIANLNSMFSEIQSSTVQVSTGSKQIADGAQSLAQGSAEQASSIEELSSSISEIATKTKENAELAEQTSKLSESIKYSAERGSHQMGEMIEAVKEINDASNSISKIIKTIDDIAFQTNILALNAAVEAARAGQHGKGFAVVAEEVRNLASKSAEAAKNTGDMIQNSMEKAALGSRIAQETSQSLEEIVVGINESSNLVAEIARASEEQSDGIAQINIGIDQVAQVVQQNSATAEQSAASSEEMSGQSDTLQQLIAQFKLKDTGETFNSFQSAAAPNQKQLAVQEKPAYPIQNNSTDNYGKY